MEVPMSNAANDAEVDLNKPTRKPITFDLVIVLPEDATPEAECYVETLNEIATKDSMLTLWDHFPIVLPKSHDCSQDCMLTNEDSDNDFFIKRGLAILDKLMETPKSVLLEMPTKLQKPEKLTLTQATEMRKKGIFTSTCCLHVGTDNWKISDQLIKGTDNIRETFLEDISLALRFGWITAKDRITSPKFSVKQSAKSFYEGLVDLLDIVIGIPRVKPIETGNLIATERTNFLASGLNLLPQDVDSLKLLFDYIKKEMAEGRKSINSIDLMTLQDTIIPTVFETDSGQKIHLDLFEAFSDGIIPCILQNIINEEIELYTPITNNLGQYIIESDLTAVEIENKLNDEVREEFSTRISRKILYNPSLLRYGIKIPKLILMNSLINCYTMDCTKVVNNNILIKLQKMEEELIKNHAILHRIEPWIENKLKNEKERISTLHNGVVYKSAVKGALHAVDKTPLYYLEKDEEFMTKVLPKLEDQLKKVKEPVRVFKWKVNKSVYQRDNLTGVEVPKLESFTMTTDTSYTGWRISNLIFWCISLIANIMLLLEVVTVSKLRSCLSEEIVVSEPSTICGKSSEYFMDKEQLTDRKDLGGTKETCTETSLNERSMKWKLPFEKFTEWIFERLKRIFKLSLGPILYLLATIAVILVVLCSPFLFIGIIVSFSVFNMIIYDFDNAYTYNSKICVLIQILWKIVVEGVLQLIVTITVAFVICPLIGMTLFMYGSIYYAIHTMRDFVVFHLLVKHMGRVHFIDMWLAKRISHVVKQEKMFKEITMTQVLRIFKARLEIDELYAYQIEMEKLIEEPFTSYKQFIDKHLTNKGIEYDGTNWHLIISEDTNKLDKQLRRKIKIRYEELQGILNEINMKSYKMTLSTMNEVIRQAMVMTKMYYTRHVFPRHSHLPIESFWCSKYLVEGDWFDLTIKILVDLFGPHILTPLDVLNTEYLIGAFPRDSFMCKLPEIISSGRWYEMKSITVIPPHLDMSLFEVGKNLNFDLTIENDQIMICYKKDKAIEKPLIRKGQEKQVKYYYGCNKTFTVLEGLDTLATPIPIPNPIQVMLMNARKCMQEMQEIENEQNKGLDATREVPDSFYWFRNPDILDTNVWNDINPDDMKRIQKQNFGIQSSEEKDINVWTDMDPDDLKRIQKQNFGIPNPQERANNVWSADADDIESRTYYNQVYDSEGRQINPLPDDDELDLYQWNFREWESESNAYFLENQDELYSEQFEEEEENWDSDHM